MAWVLLAVATLAFLFPRLAPGSPFTSERTAPEVRQGLERRYHLDRPLPEQYLRYLAGLARGDLGDSYRYRGRPVAEVVGQALPVSLALGAWALALALAVGLPAGVLAAARRGGAFDRGVAVASLGLLATPSFLLGTLLVLAFAYTLGVLPAAGWGGADHLVLPALTLAAPYAATVARLARAGLLEVLGEDFVRTARAKGASGARVLLGHALRPGLVPVAVYLGPAAADVLTGSLVVEQVFAIPGLGTHFVHSALNRDYPLAAGLVLVFATMLVAFNLAADLAVAWLDPRTRAADGG